MPQESQFRNERLRQARLSYNLVCAGGVISLLASLLGVTFTLSGNPSVGMPTTLGGAATSAALYKVYKDSNDRLDKVFDEEGEDNI